MRRDCSAVVDDPNRCGSVAAGLTIGSDPLHQPLLSGMGQQHSGWHGIRSWGERVRHGALTAALISTASLKEASLKEANPTEADLTEAGLRLIPLATRPLLLLHARQPRPTVPHHSNPSTTNSPTNTPRPWQMLLPPPRQQPLLWRQLQQLGLLPLQPCTAADGRSLLQHLQQGPYLLPAHLSLLQAPPWCTAALAAVPPPEPLQETLALLVQQNQAQSPAIKALIQRLRQRLQHDRLVMA